jgi:hypothetical protein
MAGLLRTLSGPWSKVCEKAPRAPSSAPYVDPWSKPGKKAPGAGPSPSLTRNSRFERSLRHESRA